MDTNFNALYNREMGLMELDVVVGYIGKNETYVHDEFTASSKEINDWMDKLESHGAKEAHFFC